MIPHTKLFANNHQIVKVIDIQLGILCQGVPNKDPNVWLNGAKPANTYIPLTLPRNAPAQPHAIPTPKNMFLSTKNNRENCRWNRAL